MTSPLPRDQRLYEKLKKEFAPSDLEIINESHLHEGHSGSPQTGESHYRIRIRARVFDSVPLRSAHQKIYDALKSDFENGLHALSIQILKD
tara:strand:+ start:769 stop:1041 length:273 start_codon:yes stop_codon:yes gene_type:complete